MYRDTWMEVDLDAIADNVRSIHQICGKRIIAVIKADAYGCGDIQVAKACLDAGAEMLAVSSLDEAMMLRNEGYGGEVLILGAVNPEDALVLSENGISTAAFSLDWAKEVVKHDCSGMKVHLAVDTGMNRIGFREIREMEEARDILLHAGVKLTGIFTHFCCTDTSREMTDRQYLKFAEAVSEYGTVEKQPKLEGRQMLMFIAANNAKPPKKGKKPQKQQASTGDAPAEKSE